MADAFTFKIDIPDTKSGKRADEIIGTQHPSLSRSQIKKRLASVFLNQKKIKNSAIVKTGDLLEYELYEKKARQPKRWKPDILYEDDFLVVLNKPADKVVYPKTRDEESTVADYMQAIITDASDFEDPKRAGIVHRLDKETAGILICAKDPHTERFLKKQFKKRKVGKAYQALVRGLMYQSRNTPGLAHWFFTSFSKEAPG